MSIAPVQGISAPGVAASVEAIGTQPASSITPGGGSFVQMLMDGVASVDQKVASADAMVRTFATDGSVPIHQVTYALEEARLSLELMMQIRTRLVESYQRIMEMQL